MGTRGQMVEIMETPVMRHCLEFGDMSNDKEFFHRIRRRSFEARLVGKAPSFRSVLVAAQAERRMAEQRLWLPAQEYLLSAARASCCRAS